MKQRQRFIAVMVNAMIEIFTDISEADLNKLGRAIDLMMVHTNRSLAQAVDRAGITFLKSARARTVKAKGKNRKQHGKSAVSRQLILAPSNKRMYTQREASDKYYTVYNQGVRPYFVRIPDTMTGSKKNRAQARVQRQRVIKNFKRKPRVGAAKSSWNRAFSDIGKPAKMEMLTRNVKVMASSRAKRLGTKFSPTLNITNKLSYLLKTSPDIDRQALVAAGKSLLFQVNNRIEKQVQTWDRIAV